MENTFINTEGAPELYVGSASAILDGGLAISMTKAVGTRFDQSTLVTRRKEIKKEEFDAIISSTCSGAKDGRN
ncbi:MAG: hypothetical protein LBH53_03700 [Puniceicoccales bacterium]|nr:hypothetical protein [Puniceicoccales bacterium]